MPEIGKMVMYMIGDISMNTEGPQGQMINTRYYILGDFDPLFEVNLENGLGSSWRKNTWKYLLKTLKCRMYSIIYMLCILDYGI
jgi:hypothetical protein